MWAIWIHILTKRQTVFVVTINKLTLTISLILCYRWSHSVSINSYPHPTPPPPPPEQNGRHLADDIFNAFVMKLCGILIRLFLRIQLTISENWSREWLGTEQATSHYLNQCWPILLMHICSTRERYVYQQIPFLSVIGEGFLIYVWDDANGRHVTRFWGVGHTKQPAALQVNEYCVDWG